MHFVPAELQEEISQPAQQPVTIDLGIDTDRWARRIGYALVADLAFAPTPSCIRSSPIIS